MRTLLLAKNDHWASIKAAEFLAVMGCDLTTYFGKRGEAFPENLGWGEYEFIVSFSSPWIVPGWLLERPRMGAINFHPGPPEYPGIGCTNFAIYDEASTYGVTCHHMADQVDSGPIIDVRRFPLYPTDSVKDLTDRCYHFMLAQFVEVIAALRTIGKLPQSTEIWKRKAYTRKELDELCRIYPSMPADEIRRRIRATTYPGQPGAFIELSGQRFIVEDRHA